MTLAEYLNLKKVRQIDFAKKIGITPATLIYLKQRKRSPSLWIALRIQFITGNMVTAEEMLSAKEEKKVRGF